MNNKNISIKENETIGQRLARLRKDKGLTQKELAEKLSVTRSSIAAYERDSHNLNAKLIIKITKVLKISSDEILGLKGTINHNGKPSLRFIKRINKIEKLPSSKQKALLTTIDNFLKAEGIN